MTHAQGFVLLKENRFDSAAFLRTLQQEWGITPDDDGASSHKRNAAA